MDDKVILRARDFWSALVLFGVSAFFIVETLDIPFFDTRSAGVDSAEWYNSAALVPFGIFGALLVLSVALLVISIADGGARHAFSQIGLDIDKTEILRLGCVSLMLVSYIFGIVPRVDFVIGSALLITALIWGFHSGSRTAMIISTAAIVVAGVYATAAHFDVAEWAKPHDDDWVTLILFTGLTGFMFWTSARQGALDRVVRFTPFIAVLCPLLLVLAMAFGFRQNVPNRTGLLFQQIEYHYYVTVRPFLRGQ